VPKDRAEGCEDECISVSYAFKRLIAPSIDRKMARKLHKQWLPPIETRPKRRL
jgi:hypothetical protein